jgi:hypothetical protein
VEYFTKMIKKIVELGFGLKTAVLIQCFSFISNSILLEITEIPC